jgi:hypothetical protein
MQRKTTIETKVRLDSLGYVSREVMRHSSDIAGESAETDTVLVNLAESGGGHIEICTRHIPDLISALQQLLGAK